MMYQYWILFLKNVLVCCFKQKKNKFKKMFVLKQTPLTELEMRE